MGRRRHGGEFRDGRRHTIRSLPMAISDLVMSARQSLPRALTKVVSSIDTATAVKRARALNAVVASGLAASAVLVVAVVAVLATVVAAVVAALVVVATVVAALVVAPTVVVAVVAVVVVAVTVVAVTVIAVTVVAVVVAPVTLVEDLVGTEVTTAAGASEAARRADKLAVAVRETLVEVEVRELEIAAVVAALGAEHRLGRRREIDVVPVARLGEVGVGAAECQWEAGGEVREQQGTRYVVCLDGKEAKEAKDNPRRPGASSGHLCIPHAVAQHMAKPCHKQGPTVPR